MREFCLFIHERLWIALTLECQPWEQLYSIAFVDYFHSWQIAQSLYGRIFFEICGKVDQYFERKIHASEPEPGDGDVNTVYYINQRKY